MLDGGRAQALERFVKRLITETKRSVVHWDERFRVELVEGAHRFFGIHVNFARKRRIVSADRQKGDLDVVTFANFLEAFEVGGIAAMKNRAAIRADDETAEAAMSVGEKTRAPMMRRRERDAKRTELDCLPFVEFVHDIEPEPVDQTTDPDRNDDWLIGRNGAERASIEMIEMRVSDENEIDRRQMMKVYARFLEALDHAQPHRPNRIDENVRVMRLN